LSINVSDCQGNGVAEFATQDGFGFTDSNDLRCSDIGFIDNPVHYERGRSFPGLLGVSVTASANGYETKIDGFLLNVIFTGV
jgi:hypothetical protein